MIILHVDMDAFFSSVEQRDNPELRGKPVIVGALPGNRGVVSTASYEARKYGIHSAMPINQAYARCRHGIYLMPRMSVYSRVSKEVMSILGSFSPSVEQISVDEAFLDMTGTQKLWGSPDEAAEKIADRIRKELNLTASIGIAPNKFLAKIASDINKPNGITMVPFEREDIIQWLAPMKVSKIWGVGVKTQQILKNFGIHYISDLQKESYERLKKQFGNQGINLYKLCRGIDARCLEKEENAKSFSREHTYNKDSYDPEQWYMTLLTLSRDIAKRVREAGQKGKTVVLTYRTSDFKRFTLRTTLENPTDLAKCIYETACRLLEKKIASLKTIRLIGVGITNFDDSIQTGLFDNVGKNNAWRASEKAMDKVSKRFGRNTVVRGREVSGRK